jgi:hypothetical protein
VPCLSQQVTVELDALQSVLMDPTSAVRTDVVPVIATVIAPGAFVSGPYLWAGLSDRETLRAFFDQHEAVAVASAILVWVVAGFLVESLGSYVEVYWIDRARDDHQEMLDAWWRYLRVAWDKEPIGQRYLRRLLVQFKFELNMFVAALGSIPGVIWLGFTGWLTDLTAALIIGGLCIGASALFNAANGSSEVLAKVRAELLKGVGQPPFEPTAIRKRSDQIKESM